MTLPQNHLVQLSGSEKIKNNLKKFQSQKLIAISNEVFSLIQKNLFFFKN